MRQRADRPAAEPEIIPPRRDGTGSADGKPRIWISVRTDRAGSWSSVASPGPFAAILVLLVVGMLAAVTLLIVLGTVLLWIPVLGLLFALLFLLTNFRGSFKQFRR